MHRSLIALVAAAGIGLASVAVPSTADARCFGCAVGVGVLGGLVAGAVIGSAVANSPPPPPPGYYGPPPPGYYGPPPPPPYAVAPGPAYAQLAPGCHWGKHKVWVDGVGYRVRPVQVCP
jgi:hypothetical protein